MGWLAKLLGATPKEELQGIRLDTSQRFWELDGRTDFSHLLRALGGLLPKGSILYFEGGSSVKPLVDFFHAHEIPEQSRVAVAILWPRPTCYHILATPENLQELAELAERHAAPELAVHFHVYRNAEVLLEWHDAFDQPMLLSGTLPSGKVRAFAETLHMAIKSGDSGAMPTLA
jgi:hypothetical protein